MHVVLSGPYEVLYTTGVDIWSFGCLLLAIFIGKSGPLKQRGVSRVLCIHVLFTSGLLSIGSITFTVCTRLFVLTGVIPQGD